MPLVKHEVALGRLAPPQRRRHARADDLRLQELTWAVAQLEQGRSPDDLARAGRRLTTLLAGTGEDELRRNSTRRIGLPVAAQLLPHYEQYVEPIRELTAHAIPAVGSWAGRMAAKLQDAIEQVRDQDEELDAGLDI